MSVVLHPERWAARRYIRSIRGFYPDRLALTNRDQADIGNNFLGYPALAHIRLDGTPIGWGRGEWRGIPLLQTATDITENIPALIDRYQPRLIVDLGSACGGSARLFFDLARRHHSDARIVSVDIDEQWRNYDGQLKDITFHRGDVLAPETLSLVGGYLKGFDGVALVSLDDAHDHEHVLAELHAYASLLRRCDVLLVQDTWDQGFVGHPFSPLTAVAAFIRESPEWEIDTEFLRGVTVPCNFVHGVLRKVR